MNERWRILAAGVAEHSLSFGRVLPVVKDEHPRLKAWQEEHGRLMYASSPADAARLELDLNAVHDEVEYGPAEWFTVTFDDRLRNLASNEVWKTKHLLPSSWHRSLGFDWMACGSKKESRS